ncbi:hypothetical protein LCGC14_0667190 [marine sediment metagenome]|uniref:Uncharacterized protein n=1 Tax=marine sediment metagenome TaxID=412755 RepID=A0A0F9RC43_9ZZZZ
MSYWDYKDGKKVKLKLCPVCNKRAKLSITKTHMGSHYTDDKVWFEVKCSFCNTHTGEREGCWADESVVKLWNKGTVYEDSAVKKLLKSRSK